MTQVISGADRWALWEIDARFMGWFWDADGALEPAGTLKNLDQHQCVLRANNPPPSCRMQLLINLGLGDTVSTLAINYKDPYALKEGKRQTSKLDADAAKAQQAEKQEGAALPDF